MWATSEGKAIIVVLLLDSFGVTVRMNGAMFMNEWEFKRIYIKMVMVLKQTSYLSAAYRSGLNGCFPPLFPC